jgi:hypothetical protein
MQAVLRPNASTRRGCERDRQVRTRPAYSRILQPPSANRNGEAPAAIPGHVSERGASASLRKSWPGVPRVRYRAHFPGRREAMGKRTWTATVPWGETWREHRWKSFPPVYRRATGLLPHLAGRQRLVLGCQVASLGTGLQLLMYIPGSTGRCAIVAGCRTDWLLPDPRPPRRAARSAIKHGGKPLPAKIWNLDSTYLAGEALACISSFR